MCYDYGITVPAAVLTILDCFAQAAIGWCYTEKGIEEGITKHTRTQIKRRARTWRASATVALRTGAGKQHSAILNALKTELPPSNTTNTSSQPWLPFRTQSQTLAVKAPQV